MIKMEEGFSLTVEDLRIINIISKKGDLGTIELANAIGIAPKNLVSRIKKYERLNLISKGTRPAKPKGRKRFYWINVEAVKLIKEYGEILNDLKLLSEGKSPIEIKVTKK